MEEIIEQPAGILPAAEQLAQLRRKAIFAFTRTLPLKAGAELMQAALAVRAKNRGPSKLARRMRRKQQLGLAGAF